MKITYIAHSGFLAELEHTILLFDYYQGELPELPDEKMLYVFASHRHPDHFNPEVFRLAEGREDVFTSCPGISGKAGFRKVCRTGRCV